MEYTAYELIWLFLTYSFLGWCLEVSLAAVKRRHLINKGFLNAPFCTIYGTAAVGFALFLPELQDSLFFLFLGGMLIASFLEYWSGRTMERIFHRKWWDYSEYRWNLDGYVCLYYSIIWGISAVLMMKFTNPLLLQLLPLIPPFIGRIFLWVISGLLIADAIGTSAAILQLHHGLDRITQISEDWLKLSESLGNALTRRIHRRMMNAYPNINLEYLVEEWEKAKAQADQKLPAVFGAGCSFYKLVSLFFIGAFLGDIVETIFCYVTSGVLMSRSSVVYGPFSIVWGLGCVMLTAILYQYRESNDRHIFLAGTVLGGAYEYVCSVFTELVFGTVFWDYSAIPFNLGGRINLLYCFFWGIVAVVWLKVIYPLLSAWIERLPVRAGIISCNLLIVFMVCNMAISGLALARYTVRQDGAKPENRMEQILDDRFPDSRIERIYPNLKIVD